MLSTAAAILLLSASLAWADAGPGGTASADLADLSIEDLMAVPVYGASKFEQSVSEAPSSVSIITADDIKKFGYHTLADIIRAQRGFFVTNDRNYSYVGARGIGREGGYNNRILVLVDGHRLNDNVYDAVLVANEFILDVELIDRVEIIRGPGSSLYGNSAFLAVINIYTRHGQGLRGVELSANAGSQDTYQGRLSYGGSFKNGLGVTLSGSILDSGGNRSLYYPEYDTPANNNGVARSLDYERNYRLFGAVSLRDFTLEGAYVSRTKGVPTASYGAVFNDSRYLTVDNRGYLELKYSHFFGDDWGVTGRVNFDRYYYYAHTPFDEAEAGAASGVVLNRDAATNNWLGTEFQVSKTLLDQHRLIAGAEFQDNLIQQLENHDIAPYQQFLDVDRTTRKWALYLQDEFTILRPLILNAGLRYDHFDTFGGTVNPRAALIWSPLEGTTFKGIYAEAFRAPNSYELYYGSEQLGQRGNPDLRPEKIRNVELIGEQALGDRTRLTVEGFWNVISDLISQETDADGFLVFTNRKGAESKGVELELETIFGNGMKGRASYSFADARDDRTGQTLVNSPQHMGKLNLIVPFFSERLFSGVELQYLSSRKTLAGNQTGDSFVTNLTLFSKSLAPGLALSGTVHNLFDSRYGDPGGNEHLQDIIIQDGRLFRLNASYSF